MFRPHKTSFVASSGAKCPVTVVRERRQTRAFSAQKAPGPTATSGKAKNPEVVAIGEALFGEKIEYMCARLDPEFSPTLKSLPLPRLLSPLLIFQTVSPIRRVYLVTRSSPGRHTWGGHP